MDLRGSRTIAHRLSARDAGGHHQMVFYKPSAIAVGPLGNLPKDFRAASDAERWVWIG